jgi:hypothetical protein
MYFLQTLEEKEKATSFSFSPFFINHEIITEEVFLA